MRRAHPIFSVVTGLLICVSSVSAHDCDAVLSQGVRNTYQELRTSDVRSAFALAYCSKTSSSSGRSSGTTAGGSYAGYGLDYGTNASDTSESRTENCGGESLATSDTKYLNAMKSVADPGILAAWSTCMASQTGVLILGELNGDDIVLTYKSAGDSNTKPRATDDPTVTGVVKCDTAVRKGMEIGSGGITQRCKRDGLKAVTASINTTDKPALFMIPAPRKTPRRFNAWLSAKSISPGGYMKYDSDQDLVVSASTAGGPSENFSVIFTAPRAGRYLLEAVWASGEQTEVYLFDRPLIGNCQTGISVASAVRKIWPKPTGGWSKSSIARPEVIGHVDLVAGKNTLLFTTVPCGGGSAGGRLPSVSALHLTEV
jgi:hypothetical protein